MASCATTKWQRLCFKCFPFLYKICPEGNYHRRSDRFCYCRMNEHCGDWHGGILDLKTGKEYKPVQDYLDVLNENLELHIASKQAERYMTEIGVSHEYPVMVKLRRALKIDSDKQEN